MDQENNGFERGVVKWFDANRGFGFIARAGKEDVFIHFKNILMPGFKVLYEGDIVEFEVKNTERGMQATSLVKIS